MLVTPGVLAAGEVPNPAAGAVLPLNAETTLPRQGKRASRLNWQLPSVAAELGKRTVSGPSTSVMDQLGAMAVPPTDLRHPRPLPKAVAGLPQPSPHRPQVRRPQEQPYVPARGAARRLVPHHSWPRPFEPVAIAVSLSCRASSPLSVQALPLTNVETPCPDRTQYLPPILHSRTSPCPKPPHPRYRWRERRASRRGGDRPRLPCGRQQKLTVFGWSWASGRGEGPRESRWVQKEALGHQGAVAMGVQKRASKRKRISDG